MLTIVIGVSGGSDSVSLLHSLCSVKKHKNFNFKIIAAHVNHLLRGEESLRDEDFVRNLCKDLNVPLKVLRVDVFKKTEELKKSIEETARIVRYNFFSSISKKYPDSVIATAHTLTDCVETLILNLSKGSGLAGLCGIPKIRENVIRPLLNISKAQTETYCKIHNLKYVYDSSNSSLKYLRNKIRHKILPVLKEINPNLEQSFSKTLILLKKDEEYLNLISKNKVEKAKLKNNTYNLANLRNEHFSVISRCIRIIIKGFLKGTEINTELKTITPTYNQTKLILNYIQNGHGTLQLSNNIIITIKFNKLIIFKKEPTTSTPKPKKLNILLTDALTQNPKKLIIKVIDFSKLKRRYNISEFSKNILDYESIPKTSILRTRHPKDKISLPFRNCSKSIKKFFNEEKVKVEDRDSILLLANGSNILWAEGFGPSRDCVVNKKMTKNILFIKRR